MYIIRNLTVMTPDLAADIDHMQISLSPAVLPQQPLPPPSCSFLEPSSAVPSTLPPLATCIRLPPQPPSDLQPLRKSLSLHLHCRNLFFHSFAADIPSSVVSPFISHRNRRSLPVPLRIQFSPLFISRSTISSNLQVVGGLLSGRKESRTCPPATSGPLSSKGSRWAPDYDCRKGAIFSGAIESSCPERLSIVIQLVRAIA
ncbi:uncharacterized protein EV422DRAFT_336187 [Fimicolochytrium jonesii]|uniref:uncharacterized protein n=1 Tax=Fimicolochytrium jonesii TaxID=1396493 RepID=UPI0022FDF391|nr:uncharacterized protein EV422DRAFT_336187 [Fimicolochytrium jonesii]KAI8815928.1 hypothetical protein EV422DRAFT_336187 [Fimicolochytrium jonesii]